MDSGGAVEIVEVEEIAADPRQKRSRVGVLPHDDEDLHGEPVAGEDGVVIGPADPFDSLPSLYDGGDGWR